jgi:hypothetical protein
MIGKPAMEKGTYRAYRAFRAFKFGKPAHEKGAYSAYGAFGALKFGNWGPTDEEKTNEQLIEEQT